MLQNILKLEGIEVLSKKNQQSIGGGGLFRRDYFSCTCSDNPSNSFQIRANNQRRAEIKAARRCSRSASSVCVQTN